MKFPIPTYITLQRRLSLTLKAKAFFFLHFRVIPNLIILSFLFYERKKEGEKEMKRESERKEHCLWGMKDILIQHLLQGNKGVI